MKSRDEILLGLKCCENPGHVCRVCPYCEDFEEDSDSGQVVICDCIGLHQDATALIKNQENEMQKLAPAEVDNL